MNLKEIVGAAGKVAKVVSDIILGSDTESGEQKKEPTNRIEGKNEGVLIRDNIGVVGKAEKSFVGKNEGGNVAINN